MPNPTREVPPCDVVASMIYRALDAGAVKPPTPAGTTDGDGSGGGGPESTVVVEAGPVPIVVGATFIVASPLPVVLGSPHHPPPHCHVNPRAMSDTSL